MNYFENNELPSPTSFFFLQSPCLDRGHHFQRGDPKQLPHFQTTVDQNQPLSSLDGTLPSKAHGQLGVHH